MPITLVRGRVVAFEHFAALVTDDGMAELAESNDLKGSRRELRKWELRADTEQIKVAKAAIGSPSATAIRAQTSAYEVLEASFTAELRDRKGKVLSAEALELVELLRRDAERGSVGQVSKRALLSQVSALRAALQVIGYIKAVCNLDDTRPVLSVFLQACKQRRERERIELEDLKIAAMTLRDDKKASVELVYAKARSDGALQRRKDADVHALPPSRENSREADAKASSRMLPVAEMVLHDGSGQHIRLDDLPAVEESHERDIETSHVAKEGE